MSRGVFVLLAVIAASAQAAPRQVTVDQAARAIGDCSGPRVVMFWSTTCPACTRIYDHVEARARQWSSSGTAVLAFSVDDDPELLLDFLRDRRSHLEHYWIKPWQPGQFSRAMLRVGIQLSGGRLPTPLFAALDGSGRMLGQRAGSGALREIDGWLERRNSRRTKHDPDAADRSTTDDGPLIIEIP